MLKEQEAKLTKDAKDAVIQGKFEVNQQEQQFKVLLENENAKYKNNLLSLEKNKKKEI